MDGGKYVERFLSTFDGEVGVHPHHQLWLWWKALTGLNEEVLGVT